MDKCIVCGMDLSHVEKPLTEKVDDEILSFCSPEHRNEFLQDPDKYLNVEEELE